MRQTPVRGGGLSRPINCQFVLQAYVIASIISTSGVDVLLLLTLGFLGLTFMRQMSEGLASGIYALQRVWSRERSPLALDEARG